MMDATAARSTPPAGDLSGALAKVRRHLLPFLIACYVVAYLDRVNVGFAALTMNADLKLSPEDFGFAAGIFFLGYALFEIPSNLILARTGARRWIARIMMCSGGGFQRWYRHPEKAPTGQPPAKGASLPCVIGLL